MRRPRIAVIVANQVTGDSRVIKCAITARRLGADVVIVGTSTSARRDDFKIGDVPVARVVAAPSGLGSAAIINRRDGSWLIRPLAPLAFRSSHSYAMASERRAQRRRATRTQIEDVKSELRLRTSSSRFIALRLRLDGLRAVSLIRDGWFVVRRRAYVRPPLRIGRRESGDDLESFLRDRLPFAAGYVESMIPVLDVFEPDLVHAHDIFMAAVGAAYAKHTERRGRRVPWIYDAHEWVAGLREERPINKTIAADELEQRTAPSADVIVTVGEVLADVLVAGLRLHERPTVVLNAPPKWRPEFHPGGGLRCALGIAEDVPLLVYPGVVKPKRGLETVVDALPQLPDVHLALLADLEAPQVAALLMRATDLAVDDRLHLHPYVAPHEIAPFISDATLGIYPLMHYPNAEVALPTKLLEYVQAGIPVVVSDTREMAAFVTTHGIGEVFVSGDSDSFAEAVRRVIGQRHLYSARYTPAISDEYTWERQEARLREAYERALHRPLELDEAEFAMISEGRKTK